MALTRKGVKKTAVWIAMLASAPVLLVLLVSAYSDRLNPSSFPLLSISGLLFPVALVATIVLLLVWLMFYWRGAVLFIVALLVCLPAIRQYYPINRSQEIPDDAIKVLSYNVLMFAPWGLEDQEHNPIVEFILKENADIVCLQEASSAEAGGKSLYLKFRDSYPYYHITRKKGGEWMTLLSKYPILSADVIPLVSESSVAMEYVLSIDGKEVLVVNCHLQSVGLSIEEKGDFKRMVENQMGDEEAKTATRSLLRKLRDATLTRGKQAEQVAKVIKRHRAIGHSVIVCGDFNDTPISYAHRTIAEELTDCYTATGNGAGYSYQQNGMNVRIDNILCSEEWTPYGARVDKEVETSDHFPIICCLKNNQKSKK